MTAWTEASIGAWLVRHTFQRKLLIVPNCNWTGNECDLLAVSDNLRIVDIEIKISRADLKADASKSKWWHTYWSWERRDEHHVVPAPLRWPPKVWKHYYCLPAEIWKPELLGCISPASGVLLIEDAGKHRARNISSVRRATPNRDAKPISAEHAIDIARLAGLRMWDALELVANSRRNERLTA